MHHSEGRLRINTRSQPVKGLSVDKKKKMKAKEGLPFMSGRLRHRRLQRKYFYPLVGASYRLSNKEWSLWSPCRSKCHGSIKGIKSILPLSSPQVVQTRKHSGEVRIAELGTPDKFPLILALARVTAVSALEGQSGLSSHRGQAPCCLPSEHPRKRGILTR